MDPTDDPSPHFQNAPYQAINTARLDHLAQVVAELALPPGLSVLELGAGVGDHTDFWLSRGFRVTTSDARPSVVEALRRRFPTLDVRRLDLDVDQPPTERFDIVYAYGLLYHLGDPARGLDIIAAAAGRLAFIETCVSYGDEPAIHRLDEPSADPTQAVHGSGCRPTRRWVFDGLKQRFAHVYQSGAQPAHPQFPLDWTDPASAPEDLTRTTFVASREALDAPGLFPRLLERQARFQPHTPPRGDGLSAIMRALEVGAVLDVGANVGQFASVLRAQGFTGRIVSFEPLPDASAALARRAAPDPLWETHALALGARREAATLHVSANAFSSSLLDLERRTRRAEPTVDYIEHVEVRVERLDALWPDLRARLPQGAVMLKMDVQGAEEAVLQGAGAVLDDIALVLAECSLVPIYTGERLMGAFILWMEGRGFHPVWLRPGWSNTATGQVYQCDIAFARTPDIPATAIPPA